MNLLIIISSSLFFFSLLFTIFINPLACPMPHSFLRFSWAKELSKLNFFFGTNLSAVNKTRLRQAVLIGPRPELEVSPKSHPLRMIMLHAPRKRIGTRLCRFLGTSIHLFIEGRSNFSWYYGMGYYFSTITPWTQALARHTLSIPSCPKKAGAPHVLELLSYKGGKVAEIARRFAHATATLLRRWQLLASTCWTHKEKTARDGLM